MAELSTPHITLKKIKDSAAMRTAIGLIKKSVVIGVLAGLAACQAADGTSQSPDTALVDSVMRGLGAVNPNEKPIEYQPRAPLALPAETAKLPQPETEVAGRDSASWPEQRENKQLQELKALYAKDRGGLNEEPLTPEQMRGFKVTGYTPKKRDLAAEKRNEELVDGSPLTLAEQKAHAAKINQIRAEQSAQTASGALSRQYLTEPPASASTPSPDAPMPTVVVTEDRKPSNYDPYSAEPIDPRCLAGESAYCK